MAEEIFKPHVEANAEEAITAKQTNAEEAITAEQANVKETTSIEEAGASEQACIAENASSLEHDCCDDKFDDIAHKLLKGDPFRPRWADFADPEARTSAHIIDELAACGHYIHVNGGGRSGRKPLLCALLAQDGQMSQRELMCKFDLKAGSLSEILTKLEKAGLIVRTRDEADRRQLNISLTKEGRAEAEAEQAHREKFHHEALACLSAEERPLLEDMLNRVLNHWRSLDD